ncbi:MAG: hypothetical protein LBB72_08685 [Spirochaetaceae bacterium]|jgi:hypothetical protein|nr:hypothetical protein [Spirochaetaceae bacterium]
MVKHEDRYITPLKVFLLYIAAAFIVICGIYLFFPGFFTSGAQPVILQCFTIKWRFSGGLITFINLFPVLCFSALVIPFGLKEHSEGGYAGSTYVGKKGFSNLFLAYISWPVITAAIAAVLYGLLFFMVLPLAMNMKNSLIDKSELFTEAKIKAKAKCDEKKWSEAGHFITICDTIWPNNKEKELEAIKKIAAGSSSSQTGGQNGTITETDKIVPIWQGIPGMPVDSTDALKRADEAYKRERYYDAAWLASLAEKLAKPGAAEIATATALAAKAWDRITGLAPNALEEERYSLYLIKLDGFTKMNANDWISAYYIFQELSHITPNDPDVVQYLKNCKAGVSGIAFFIDEMETAIGKILAGSIFSMPGAQPGESDETGGRLALRFSSLVFFPDYAYAWGCEAIAADNEGNFLYRANADYAKLIPANSSNSKGEPVGKTALLLQALDRNDQNKRHDPLWIRGETAGITRGSPGTTAGNAEITSQITLNISYEDLLVLSGMSQETGTLNLWELFSAEKKFADYGYVQKTFRAEILRRMGDALFFLPMSVLALILGWRYRAKKKPRYVYVPMLIILPLVFYGVLFFYRNILNNLAIQLSINMGLSAAILCLCAGAVVCFTISLIFLAAQHG